jgi:glyoxylase-like metal-dependent hydrolase (beta-lactamase superfamily II)/rhodanese-related sulfurtransferase
MTPVSAAKSISVNELLPLLDDPGDWFLLDVREPDEVAQWRIPGSFNVPLAQLADRLNEVPLSGHVVTICAAGLRATKAAELLNAAGRRAVVLDGGMSSWGSAYDTVGADLAGAHVVQVRRRGKGCLSYVVVAGGHAVVIDPSTEIDRYLDIASAHDATVTHVFDTHLHADHLSGARALAAQTGAALVLNPADPFDYPFTPITDGLRVELAPDVHLTVSAVTAPGHTEGSTVYLLGDCALFTGDTLFLESVGRPDLADQAEQFAHALYRSLHDVVLAMSDDVLILPAHFGETVEVSGGTLVAARLGELRRTLPALALDEHDFVEWAVARVTDRPPNYKEIVKFNAGHSALAMDELRQLELGPNRCAIAR